MQVQILLYLNSNVKLINNYIERLKEVRGILIIMSCHHHHPGLSHCCFSAEGHSATSQLVSPLFPLLTAARYFGSLLFCVKLSNGPYCAQNKIQNHHHYLQDPLLIWGPAHLLQHYVELHLSS